MIDLVELGKCFIYLYYKAGKKYKLSRSKLLLLCEIVGFCYMKKIGEEAFEYPINSNNFKTLFFSYFGDDIIDGEIIEDCTPIKCDSMIQPKINLNDDNIDIPPIYKLKEGVTFPIDLDIVSDIFYKFGNYDKRLYLYIYEFEDAMSSMGKDGKKQINPNLCQHFFNGPAWKNYEKVNYKAQDIFNMKEFNPVIDFVKNYKINIKPTKELDDDKLIECFEHKLSSMNLTEKYKWLSSQGYAVEKFYKDEKQNVKTIYNDVQDEIQNDKITIDEQTVKKNNITIENCENQTKEDNATKNKIKKFFSKKRK